MKIWSVFSLVIVFHVGVIGVLLIQPGCQSQSPDAPDPSMTTPQTGTVVSEPVEEPLDPAFNAGVQPATSSSNRAMSSPRRPAGVTRTEPDTGTLQPVLDPVQDDLSLPAEHTEYAVKKGDNLTIIARRHGISLSDLLSANGLNRSSTIYVGQVLLIPLSAPVETNGSMEIEHSGKYVVVASGDTLSKIAARTGTTVKILKAMNGLTRDTIYVGQKLAVPEGASGARTSAPQPAPSRTQAVSSGTSYEVQPGDTPSGIARKFGVSTSSLMAVNGISDPRRLYVGQKLVIPGTGGATASQSTTSTSSTRVTQPRTQTVTTPPDPVPAEPTEEDPMSILEALEDEDLPFVEVEAVEEDSQPGS